jgi:2-keto-4-pentenoate hydratase/2-oxohepta-3-ene-1,7-dioic acid hydratase in catechol pathway
MRWVRFKSNDGRTGFGTLDGGQVAEYEGDMFSGARPNGRRLQDGEYVLQSPCAPSKIIALWNNFHALALKLGKSAPLHPLFLIKPATSVIGPGEPIRRPLGYDGKIAYEGELGVVIGKRAKDVPPEHAADHIFGFTCVNDVTAMAVLNENADFAQWCRSKGYDTFGCLGPAVVTDLDWSASSVITRLDAVVRQNYPLSDMIIPPAELVSLLSHDMTLLPGDVIACGTSVGVGSMKEGSVIDICIEGIGSLKNVFAAAVP